MCVPLIPSARRKPTPDNTAPGVSVRPDYAVQLREKQKVRRIYGVLERQFRNYYKRADRQRCHR